VTYTYSSEEVLVLISHSLSSAYIILPTRGIRHCRVYHFLFFTDSLVGAIFYVTRFEYHRGHHLSGLSTTEGIIFHSGHGYLAPSPRPHWRSQNSQYAPDRPTQLIQNTIPLKYFILAKQHRYPILCFIATATSPGDVIQFDVV
jgi:hypothetical protein